MESLELDRIDRRMLAVLQEDGRIPNSALARRVGLSESATLRRLRRLEDSGLIDGYVLLVNQARAGKPGNIFVEIALTAQEEAALSAFEAAVQDRPEILECYLMSGEYDYLLRVVVADFADYERIHREHLTRLPFVGRVRSSFTLRTVLRRTSIPL
ncbi:MAG: Lrp/AsnC family transcriptional regulator [Pseudomonadota bacterium]|jgi:DNA-binding Lrp family transcriptional regulator|nr:Lrp/AsnC family transcriptional regulator [Pseudomonadota bacterium]MEC8718166.1 Lrp/AsnC family transcriptional regulator [Pseudomonadota bacterium]MED5442763.1 Lrp/AsnC family transcriptional regulator [Pseudomonadota bacterium]